MRPQMRQRRGMTMLEMMMVVAIIGIFGALSASGLTEVVKSSRVVSSTKGLAAMLRSARVRATALNCPLYVQVNGPTYAQVSVTGFPTSPGMMTLLRKANCASATMSFEVGDVVVDRRQLGPDDAPSSVTLELPVTVLSSQAMSNQSVAIGFTPKGARTLWLDATGMGETGFAAVSAVDGLDLVLNLHEAGSSLHPMTVVVQPAGEPRVQ